MTVYEMIRELAKCPPDFKVEVYRTGSKRRMQIVAMSRHITRGHFEPERDAVQIVVAWDEEGEQ